MLFKNYFCLLIFVIFSTLPIHTMEEETPKSLCFSSAIDRLEKAGADFVHSERLCRLKYLMELKEDNIFSEDYLESVQYKVNCIRGLFKKNNKNQVNDELGIFRFVSQEWASKFVKNLCGIFGSIGMNCSDSILKNLEVLFLIDDDAFICGTSQMVVWEKNVKYQKNIEFANSFNIARKHELFKTLPINEIMRCSDFLLANIVFQEPLKTYFKGENIKKKLKESFLDTNNNLLTARHDIEIASVWLNQTEPKRADEIIAPYVGRVFFVEEKEGARVIRYMASGTTVGGPMIFTARHMGKIDKDKALEIYFIPHKLLSSEEYLPINRIEEDENQVDWDIYKDYQINKISLVNTPEMESILTFSDDVLKITPKNQETLNLEQIKKLKMIEDNPDNSDTMFLHTVKPELLGEGVQLLKKEESKRILKNNKLEIWAAGYPSFGLSDFSFAVVGSSKSKNYCDSINYEDQKSLNKNWNYCIGNIPALHGMSGGPVFFVSDEKPYLVGNLTGVDLLSCGTLYALSPY